MALYKYVGTAEALLSSHDLIVKPGDIIETDVPIENANFERLSEDEPVPAPESPAVEIEE